MSNPYYGGYSPYEPTPGGEGWGTQPPTPSAPAPPGTDGISIAAFISALTCCAAPVAVGLGIAGIVRTGGGRRSGRWAAVTGLVLGIVGTLALIAGMVAVVVIGTTAVFEDEAKVGQCVDATRLSDDNDLWKASCSEEHDAEIIAVFQADAEDESRARTGTKAACAPYVHDDYAALLEDDTYRLDFSTDGSYGRIEADDWIVCYLERKDGAKITGPLPVGGEDAETA